VSQKDILGISIVEMKVPGMVALYEEYAVKDEGGYNVIEWEGLSPIQRAYEVAYLRIKRSIEYQKSKAEERAMKRGNQ
jgi:hypothetical protein